jgi:hypothetical protein
VSKLKYSFYLLLVVLSFGGWYVLLVQKPDILLLARLKYIDAMNKKVDLSSGPCLGKLKNDWVLDIVHLPRESVDNLTENQCEDYLLGRVHHFVEMTSKGEVVTVK